MNDTIVQALSLVGAVVILAAYAAQAFKLLAAGGRLYLTLNFVGGALLCVAAVSVGQIGFIILEGAWALISLFGLLRVRTNSVGLAGRAE